MENSEEKIIKKTTIMVKNFFKKETNMKLLVGYIIANLMYLLIGSYIYFTKKLANGFQYKEFSIGLKYLLIANIIVLLLILIKKKYNKNIVHFGIGLAIILRHNIYHICN